MIRMDGAGGYIYVFLTINSLRISFWIVPVKLSGEIPCSTAVAMKNAMIGINSVVMDCVLIGENSFVAAMAFVKSKVQVPDNVLVAGAPAKVVRKLTKEEIDLLVPHQANLRISNYIQQKLNLEDGKVYNNIQRLGNTTGASIPIALSEAWEEGKIKENDLICLAAFGSGFTWASALINW